MAHEELSEEWKSRAPYRIHEPATFKARYEASCHCGLVTYQLSREKPLDAKYCHCTTCQVLHAAPFQWAAIFHKEDINFNNGHQNLKWYDSQSKTTRHQLPCKVSCKYCGTHILDEGRRMILMFPTLIKFKSEQDRKKFEPSCHIFYGNRVLDIPDGKPKWSGLNQTSELMNGSPSQHAPEAGEESHKVDDDESKQAGQSRAEESL